MNLVGRLADEKTFGGGSALTDVFTPKEPLIKSPIRVAIA